MNWIYNFSVRIADIFRFFEPLILLLTYLFERLLTNVVRFAIIGILLNIITYSFYPEFPSRFPIIYGWFDGWLQLVEFGVKAAIGLIYSIFNGNFNEFLAECTVAFESMRFQFVTWLGLIHF